MIRAYFDDSSDSTRSHYFVVGGLLAPATSAASYSAIDGWDAVELRWLSATHELTDPFRSTDCETGHGQFEGWLEERRRTLMRELTSILVDSPLTAVAVVVPVQEFRKVFSGFNDYGPYYLGVQYLMAALANYGQAVDPLQDLAFTFEDSEATSGRTLELFNQLKSVRDWGAAKRLTRIAFSDKRVLALQAADLFAREAFKHFDNLEVLARPIRKPLARMLARKKAFIYSPSARALQKIRDLGWPENVRGLAEQAEIR